MAVGPRPRGSPLFLALLLLAVLASQPALSSILAVYPAGVGVDEVAPPLTLHEAGAPASIGENGTSAEVNYTITTNYYDAVAYSTFDDGFAGWYYTEYDPDGVLYGYWWSGGYVSLSGRNVPTGYGAYGAHALYTVLEFTSYNIVSMTLNISVNVYRDWFTDQDTAITIFIYNYNTSTVEYVVGQITVPYSFIGITGWQTYSFPVDWRPTPGYTYLLVLYYNVSYGLYFFGLVGSYNYDVMFDNVSLTVYTSTYSAANVEALNLTLAEGAYNVSLVLVGVSGQGNATVTLANGAYASTSIRVVNGSAVAGQTSWVPFNASDTLLSSGLVLVDASLNPGDTLTLDLLVVYTNGAVVVVYPVRLTLSTP